MQIFINLDACVMPIKSFQEACDDPQMKARKMIIEMDHPKLGKIQNVASPIKYSRTPIKLRNFAPKPGQNTKEILRSLGYSKEKIQDFKKNGLL